MYTVILINYATGEKPVTIHV